MNISTNCCSVAPEVPRMWDNASYNLSISDVILDQAFSLNQTLQTSMDGTFTVLDSIAQTINTIESQCIILNTQLINTVYSQLIIDNSLAENLESTLIVEENKLQSIHVNDFGGTWTALNALNSTINQNFSTDSSLIDVIESQLSELTALQQSNFIATFTALLIISNNVLNELITIESLSVEVMANLSQIDQSIFYANGILLSADSQLDIFNTLLYDFNGTFTVINALTQEAFTIESKLSHIEQEVVASQAETIALLASIESNIATIESTLFQVSAITSNIDMLVGTILNSIATDNTLLSLIDREISIVDNQFVTIDSAVNNDNLTALTIESLLEALDSGFSTEISSLIIILSKVGLLNSYMQTTIFSKVALLDTGLNIIQSDLEAALESSLGSNISELNNQVSIVNVLTQTISSNVNVLVATGITMTSKVDVVDSAMVTILNNSNTMSSKIDYNNSLISVLNTMTWETIASELATLSVALNGAQNDTLNAISAVTTTNSKVSILSNDTQILSSEIDVVNTDVISITSKISIINSSVGNSSTISSILLYDMQNTWTILNAINQILLSTINEEKTLLSKINIYSPHVDFTGVYTTIAVLNNNANSIISSSSTLASRISNFDSSCATNLGPTFTAIQATYNAIATAESAVDAFTTDLQNIVDFGGVVIGIPIVGGSFSGTYTISTPGRYILSSNIQFNPGAPTCIYVNTGNVHISLCGQTIQQIGSTTGITAIQFANGVTNVSVENGTITGFTGNAIEFAGNNSFIRIRNMFFMNNSSNQLVINSAAVNEGANNIYLQNLNFSGGNADNIQFNNSSGIFVSNCVMNGASSGSGLNVNACDYLVAQNCTMDNNMFGLSSAATSKNNQQFGLTNFVLDQCNAISNQIDGFRFMGYNINGVMINCIASNNTSGIHFGSSPNQIYKSQINCVYNNVSSKNLSYGIYLDANVNNNVYAFNEMFSNTSINFLENQQQGPNSVLGNFAFHTTSTSNYVNGLTYINTATIGDSFAFSSPEPAYWVSVAMSP